MLDPIHTWEEQKAQLQRNKFLLVKSLQNPFEVLKLSFEVGFEAPLVSSHQASHCNVAYKRLG
jgi:hypothetical protein